MKTTIIEITISENDEGIGFVRESVNGHLQYNPVMFTGDIKAKIVLPLKKSYNVHKIITGCVQAVKDSMPVYEKPQIK